MNESQVAKLKKALENKQLSDLNKKIDDLVTAIKNTPAVKIIAEVPPSIKVSNFEKAPDEIKVKNLGEIVIPKEITVKNLGDIKIPAEVSIKNFPEPKEIQKVEITNHKEAKDITPFFTKLFKKGIDEISQVITSLFADGIQLKYDANNPLHVMHVDEKGAPIGRQNLQVYGGGASGSAAMIPTNITHGKVSVAVPGTAVVLGPTSSKIKKVTIAASFNNAGIVWVGSKDVSAANEFGVPLIPGATYELSINNLATIFIDAINADDKVSYTALS
ncbi:MAG: hypothetical protein PHO56_02225 [Patescibacteria group bacterium]|nr:hypothetical protein [Patescibacteria group bacterium]